MANVEAMLQSQDLDKAIAARRARTLPALLGVAAAAGCLAALAVLSDTNNAILIICILAAFATAGVFAVLAWTCGLLHFGTEAPLQDLAINFLSVSRDGVAITDAEGTVLFANKAYLSLTGQHEGAVPGIDKMIGNWAGSPERAFKLMRSARQGKGWTLEFETGLPNWPVQCLKVSVAPLRNANAGQRAGPLLAWQISDVTAERQREAEALAKLSFTAKSMEAMNIGVVAVNPTGRIAFMNRVMSDWLGIGEKPAEQLNFVDFLSENGLGLLETIDFSAPSQNIQSYNLDMIRQDGTVIPVHLFYKIEPVSGKDDLKLLCAVFNEAVAPYAAYMAADDGGAVEMRFAKLFQAAPIAMGRVGRDGRLAAANASLINLLGLKGDRRPISSIDIISLVDEESREALRAAIAKALAYKAGIPPVAITLAADPKRTGRLYISPPLPGPYGSLDHDTATLYGIDTSEQRALQEQVTQSQKMQAVGQLAGGIAHDFNNVLTAIIGFSDLLLLRHLPGDPSFKDIMNIKQNANRAAGLVRQLLAFSSRQTLRPRVLLITDILEDLAILLGRLLGEKVTAKVVHGRDLWLIKADQNQLEQVVINLAVNARDAMPDGGTLTIRTANISERESLKLAHKGLKQGEYVLCEVSDTGTGIPPEIQEKIFEPFFSTKEVGKGTGLGLSTVYGIVKQTGGHITVDSQPGEGATFRIYLPRYIEAEAEKAATAAKVEKKDKPRDLTGSGTVLLVEDEEAVRAVASRALTNRGYKVVEAVSGVDAVNIMRNRGGEIDLVISDVVMPEMDGPTLLKHLRRENPDLKFIFMSGYAEDAFKGNIGETEQFTFLPKPFSVKQLAAAVKEALGSPG